MDDFHHETRAWLEENCPVSVRGPGFIPWGSRKTEVPEDAALWLTRMADKGWTVPTWPREYGGGGLSKDEYLIVQQEMQRIGARAPLTGRGINYIGPTILEFGTDEQKARWLPRCARGDGGWCMGYSEPGAGSDLASLTMRCTDEGDYYRLNGMKIWTSDGMFGDWIFCLVRTDPDTPKHEGISLILVDMDQPGVRVRPIQLLSGNSPFCETTFEDACGGKDDLIGGVNNGWSVGKRLLQYERSVHGGVNTSGAQVTHTVRSLGEMALAQQPGTSRITDTSLRERITRLGLDERAYALTQKRVIAETDARAPSLATSILKVTGAHNTMERAELQTHLMGTDGQFFEDGPADAVDAQKNFLTTRAVSIYGGTSEIQLNIIAKRVLGLPDPA